MPFGESHDGNRVAWLQRLLVAETKENNDTSGERSDC
jgi:hypothetical protein